MAPKSSTAGGLKASETFLPGRGDLVLLFNVSCYCHGIIDVAPARDLSELWSDKI